MRKIRKIIITLCLLMFFCVSMNVSASVVVPSSIENKLETNSTYTGDKFRVGIMENYYKIVLSSSNNATVYNDVKILQCSDTMRVSSLSDLGIQRNCTILGSEIAGFSISLPRGYEYTLLYGLGLSDSTYSNDNTENTTDISVKLSSNDYTICTSAVSSSSLFYSPINSSQTYATLFLVGDVIKTRLTVEQYQKWWWGDQKLYTEEVTAYVICNLHDYVEYSN